MSDKKTNRYPIFLRYFSQFALTLIAGSFLIFAILQMLPGNIQEIHNLSSETASKLHLDKGFFARYFIWLWNCFQFDFGVSLVKGEPVASLIGQYGFITLYLTLGSVLLSLIIALPVGVVLGLNPQSRQWKWVSLFFYSLSSIPVFVLGYIVLAIFFGVFKIYTPQPPSGPFDFWLWFSYYIVPVIVLGFGNGTLGEFIRIIALETQQINHSLYIRSTRSRNGNLAKHFYRSLLLPIVNVIVTNIAVLLGGVVIVERVFNFHGLGWLSWEATLKRDFSVLLAITLIMAFIVRAGMLIYQVMAYRLDPRLSR